MEEVERLYVLDTTPVFARAVLGRMSIDDEEDHGTGVAADSRVRYLDTISGETNVGLSKEMFEEVLGLATHIMYFPARLDRRSHSTLSSYEHNLADLRALVDLSLASPHAVPPRLLLISSDCILRNVDPTQPHCEEFVDAKVALGEPYSEFLWVAEQLLALASRTTAMSATTVRVGQLAGSFSEDCLYAAPQLGWVPSLIKSSINLGCIPMFSESISWMKPEDVANALIELRNTPSNFSPLHVAHPRPVSWKVLFGPLVKRYGLQPVTLSFWCHRLAQSGGGAWEAGHGIEDGSNPRAVSRRSSAQPQRHRFHYSESLGHNGGLPEGDKYPIYNTSVPIEPTNIPNPALHFASFFHTTNKRNLGLLREGRSFAEAMGLPRLDVTRSRTVAAKRSLSAERLKELRAEDMLQWVSDWEKIGFLP